MNQRKMVLIARYRDLFKELILRSAQDGRFKDFAKLVSRYDLNTVLVPVQWSKFPFRRDTTVLAQERLDDGTYVDELARVMAQNWAELLLRSCNDTSLFLLLRFTADDLLVAMSRNYVNTAMGDKLAADKINDVLSADVDRVVSGSLSGSAGASERS